MSSHEATSNESSPLAMAPQNAGIQPTLTPEQAAALNMLQGGDTIARTAREVGVDRKTIYNWLKHDAAFAAAYHQWREELAEESTARLHAVCARAVENLQDVIDAGDPKYSLQLLKGLGFFNRGKAAK